MKIRPLFFAVVIFLSAIVTQAAYIAKPTLEQLTADADLIFQGSLINIEYRDSAGGIAHTFATYKVENVLKGAYKKPSITLRFTGGYEDNGKSQKRLIVSHAPRFTIGEQGIMMVRGNGEAETICPLVECIKGRFMIEGPYIITARGAVLATDTKGKLTHISRTQARDVPPANDDTKSPKAPLNKKPRMAPMSHESFVTHLSKIIARQKSVQKKSTTNETQRVVISADPNIPFIIKNKEAYQ